MYYEEESGAGNFMLGVLVGAVLGAGVALLTTPQTGKSMRTRLVRVGRQSRDSASDVADDGESEMDRAEIMRRLKRHRRRARH